MNIQYCKRAILLSFILLVSACTTTKTAIQTRTSPLDSGSKPTRSSSTDFDHTVEDQHLDATVEELSQFNPPKRDHKLRSPILHATVMDGVVVLTWNTCQDFVCVYSLYRKKAGEAKYVHIAGLVSSPGDVIYSYTDKKIQAGSIYSYSIEATGDGHLSDLAPEILVSLP